MATRDVRRIERVGRRLQWLVRGLMLLTPVAVAAVLARRGPLGLVKIPPGIEILAGPLPLPRAFAVVAVGLLEPISFLVGLVFLDRLFGLYARGVVFSRDNVTAIRRAGYVLVAIDPVRVLQSMLAGPVLTLVGATRGFFVIEAQVSMLIVGLFVVLISHVMNMSRELHEDDQLTV